MIKSYFRNYYWVDLLIGFFGSLLILLDTSSATKIGVGNAAMWFFRLLLPNYPLSIANASYFPYALITCLPLFLLTLLIPKNLNKVRYSPVAILFLFANFYIGALLGYLAFGAIMIWVVSQIFSHGSFVW